MNVFFRDVYTMKEEDFIRAASKYPSRRGFFEMVRFDFVIDSKMNVYLMEVNMSPNLSSKHFAPNRLLYEQVHFRKSLKRERFNQKEILYYQGDLQCSAFNWCCQTWSSHHLFVAFNV
jgi:hypothetical protein